MSVTRAIALPDACQPVGDDLVFDVAVGAVSDGDALRKSASRLKPLALFIANCDAVFAKRFGWKKSRRHEGSSLSFARTYPVRSEVDNLERKPAQNGLFVR